MCLFNRFTAVDAYMCKSEGPLQTNHKKSTVRSKIQKATLKRRQLIVLIGERAKRARHYLVMFMEVRDIYIRLITRVSV